jgi:hypothetical protein
VLATIVYTASLSQGDARVFALTALPALPAGVSVSLVPTLDTFGQISGFTLQASAALAASTAYRFAWAPV